MKKLEKIKLTVLGGGLSVRRTISQDTAGKIIAICLSEESEIGDLVANSKKGNRKEAVTEYFKRHSPDKYPAKILTLAGYLTEARGQDSFHQGEIRNMFREVGEALPANFTRDFTLAVKDGWLAPDPTKKKNYFVTNTGFRVLETGSFSKLKK